MDLSCYLGVGVIGNFSGHLDDAHEADSFATLHTDKAKAPKGIFPFYMPGATQSPLQINPLSSTEIILPKNPEVVQAEPELALLCNLEYKDHRITAIHPTHFAAANDCSIRRDGGKLSLKKNWGKASHGISKNLIPLDSFKRGSVLDSYRLSSFLKRDGVYHAYGVDSAVVTYMYFYNKLMTWLLDRLNNQEDEGPIENFSEILKATHEPKQLLLFVGATRYEDFAKDQSLKAKDEILIYLYDCKQNSSEEILNYVKTKKTIPKHVSLLKQIVKTTS